MADKTSIWIGKLSPSGKEAMHSFLVYFNTKKMDDKSFDLSSQDKEALSVIVQRLKLQNSVEDINKAIEEFNNVKHTDLTKISE